MKYKLILSIMVGILLIAGAIAVGERFVYREISIDRDTATALSSRSITEIEKGQMTCDGEKCWIHLYKANIINTDIITSATKDLTTCERAVCRIEEREVCAEPICDEKGNCDEPICEINREEVCDEPVCTTTRVAKTRTEIVADLDEEFNKRMIDVNNQLTPRTPPVADSQDTATAITIRARTATPILNEPIEGEIIR